jgi:hypothetical protein
MDVDVACMSSGIWCHSLEIFHQTAVRRLGELTMTPEAKKRPDFGNVDILTRIECTTMTSFGPSTN